MTTADMFEQFKQLGWRLTTASDRGGSFSRCLVRGVRDSGVVIGVGGEASPEQQANSFVDVLALRHQRQSSDPALLLVGIQYNPLSLSLDFDARSPDFRCAPVDGRSHS